MATFSSWLKLVRDQLQNFILVFVMTGVAAALGYFRHEVKSHLEPWEKTALELAQWMICYADLTVIGKIAAETLLESMEELWQKVAKLFEK